MKMRIRAASLSVVALAGALSGCGAAPDGIDREAVSGSVTLDGRALSGGSITLIPTGEGPSAGGTIAEGTFSLGRADGPSPGAYRVEILSIQPTGRTIPDPDGPRGSTVEERRNVVPDRYGLKSGLKADVKKGEANSFRFELNSEPDQTATKRRR